MALHGFTFGTLLKLLLEDCLYSGKESKCFDGKYFVYLLLFFILLSFLGFVLC